MAENNAALLEQILVTLKSIQHDNTALSAAVDAINGRVNALADVKELKDAARPSVSVKSIPEEAPPSPTEDENQPPSEVQVRPKPSSAASSRIILTTYPGQSGIDPLPMSWGEKDPDKRGPVVVARGSSTVRRRNGWSQTYFYPAQPPMSC